MTEEVPRTTGSVSPRRADTRRNHERILAVAAMSLAESGEVSFNAIARQAEVGVGTVYRHFPNPEALILAVYQREVDHLVQVVPSLLARYEPEQAFRRWVIDHLARYMMTKRGLATALSTATAARGTLPTHAYDAMVGAVQILLNANVAVGTVRADVTATLVLRGLSGMMLLDPHGDWRREATGLTDLLWRGMGACPDRER